MAYTIPEREGPTSRIREATNEKYSNLVSKRYEWKTNALDIKGLKKYVLTYSKQGQVKVRKGAFERIREDIIINPNYFAVFLRQNSR